MIKYLENREMQHIDIYKNMKRSACSCQLLQWVQGHY